jgi:hypothetical protein
MGQGAGHYTNLEKSEVVTKAIEEFIESQNRSALHPLSRLIHIEPLIGWIDRKLDFTPLPLRLAA